MYPYGLIGNCQTAALISTSGSIDWLCLPRPDSPPVFGRLLDTTGGHFSVEGEGELEGEQSYLPNSPVLVTTLRSKDGSVFKITDFCPRFYQHGRMYRPIALFRIVEPLRGSPTIRVSCQPVNGWHKEPVKASRGNSHLKFELQDDCLRLLTNMPLTYLTEQTPFVLKETLYFGLTWGFPIEDDLVTVTRKFLGETLAYWDGWVKHCSIPSLFQRETIRSAITLKLHCYEDTGAILAGVTTSLPEELGKTRNWDYRFCWLRDSFYTLTAFHNLGHFEEMEGFLKFLLNIAEQHEHAKERLHPVYRLDQSLPLPEHEHPKWEGFGLSSPVRSNNQAAEHVQNDVYGEMILALAPIFLDERFLHLRTPEHERLMERLARFCANYIGKHDAGLWELRGRGQEHSFSNLMCWAGLDRVQKIRERGYLNQLNLDLGEVKMAAEDSLRKAIRDGSLRNGPADESFDAALLQVATLRFPDLEICARTVAEIQRHLQLGEDKLQSAFLYRYLREDDFGKPTSAFLICSFWLVQALARVGRTGDAKSIMAETMKSANHLGLFSEHFNVTSRLQLGNFPQAYSHVGQINAAFAISPSWSEIL